MKDVVNVRYNLASVFNDLVTTEILTYGLTLTHHDALPLCSDVWVARLGAAIRLRDENSTAAMRAGASRAYEGYTRSEEHTSELQALMRIPYAVFCLKKQN